MIGRKELEKLTPNELEDLIRLAQEVLAEKRRAEKTFEFEFEATNDPRKGVPYVARLFVKDGKIQREFFNLDKVYGKKEVTVSGKYRAKPGDIIEIRWGGSWKNDYRAWFLIDEDGKERRVADVSESRKKALVKKYLEGKISMEELLQLTG